MSRFWERRVFAQEGPVPTDHGAGAAVGFRLSVVQQCCDLAAAHLQGPNVLISHEWTTSFPWWPMV
jgi:hypothetical protein